MKLPNTPRGFLNNNPGNIRYSPNNEWRGQTAEDAEGFCIFSEPAYGIRALRLLLASYMHVYDLITVNEIINRYAPPSENDTETYIKFVCSSLEVEPDEDISGLKYTTALVRAIIRYECGTCPYDIATLLGEPRPTTTD